MNTPVRSSEPPPSTTRAQGIHLHLSSGAALIKTLSRNKTLIIKLMISKSSDIEALVEYWSTGGRAKDIRPLLESLARVPCGASIDIAHLLPPLARRLLYTFPYPSDGRALSDRNCFWTALNFFNEEPNENYRSDRDAFRILLERSGPTGCVPAQAPLRTVRIHRPGGRSPCTGSLHRWTRHLPVAARQTPPSSPAKTHCNRDAFFVSRATSDPSYGVQPSGGPDRLKPGLHAISPGVRVP